jgi:hypothetical protein
VSTPHFPPVPSQHSISTDTTPTPEATSTSPSSGSTRRRFDGVIVWAIATVLICSYVALGSLKARFWQLDVFQQAWTQKIESRRVLHIWSYQLDHLPEVSSEGLLKAAFGGALFVVILGTVIGMWIILDHPKTSLDDRTAFVPGNEADTSHVRSDGGPERIQVDQVQASGDFR